jgi:two-component system LytT family response regulator
MDEPIINAIIVDDVDASALLLQQIVKENKPEIKIVAIANTIDIAYEVIITQKPDLVFLDIDLGSNKTCFQLLERILNIDFKIIFVTAHNQFAIKAIKYAALDYILKPVNADELIAAIDNALKAIYTEKNYGLLLDLK